MERSPALRAAMIAIHSIAESPMMSANSLGEHFKESSNTTIPTWQFQPLTVVAI